MTSGAVVGIVAYSKIVLDLPGWGLLHPQTPNSTHLHNNSTNSKNVDFSIPGCVKPGKLASKGSTLHQSSSGSVFSASLILFKQSLN